MESQAYHYFPEHGNNNSYVNDSVKNIATQKLINNKTVIQVTLVSVTFLFIIILNLRVLLVVIDSPGRKLKPISKLVANLSCVCIGLAFSYVIYTAEKLKVIGFSSQSACVFLSFYRNLMGAAFPLNIAGIVYERVSAFRETDRKLLVKRTIFCIWSVAAISSSPSMFWIQYEFTEDTKGRCKQVNLFESFAATVAFGIWRLFLLNLVVNGYLISALFKIRSKLKFLYISQIPTTRLRNTVRRLRFIYIYTIFFVITWFPVGISLFIVSIAGRAGVKYTTIQPWIGAMLTSNYVFMGLSPFLFTLLYEKMSKICFPFKCQDNNSMGSRESSNQENIYGNPQNGSSLRTDKPTQQQTTRV